MTEAEREALREREAEVLALPADLASLHVDWFYRHANSLPFARRIGRKRLFSEHGLARWLATRAS